MGLYRKLLLAVLPLGLLCSPASAASIVSAVSATASSEASPSFDIGNTIDQSGLSTGYTSGVTDFDTYIGANPTHSLIAGNLEWFSASGVNAATVNYDLGSVMNIDRLALWNEEGAGFGTGNILTSIDNILFTLLTTINPFDNPVSTDYPAEIFSFAATAIRFFRFEISGCPQPGGTGFNGCGIGEVAFSNVGSSSMSPVPLPAALPLFIGGLGALGLLGRRRKKSVA